MFERIEVTIDNKSVSVLIEKQPRESTSDSSRPVCFVVGLSSHYHDKFSKEFREFYQLVLIDLYWTDSQFSASYIETLNMDMLSVHIEQVRAQLEHRFGEAYRKIFITAHSAYGFISVDYALKYPEKLFGVINIASPLIFREELLVQWQEEYIDSNFGSRKAGGPTIRFFSYYDQKRTFYSHTDEKQGKDSFVRWYLSMGALLWEKQSLWQNEDGQAAKIWDPWEIPVFNTQKGIIESEVRDINIAMLSHYMALVKNKDCFDQIPQIQIPLLWVLALFDSRVSIYQLEGKKFDTPENVEFFHPAYGSHWPMYPKDGDTAEFDVKALTWGEEIMKGQYHEAHTAYILS